jgi:hypothetical protein
MSEPKGPNLYFAVNNIYVLQIHISNLKPLQVVTATVLLSTSRLQQPLHQPELFAADFCTSERLHGPGLNALRLHFDCLTAAFGYDLMSPTPTTANRHSIILLHAHGQRDNVVIKKIITQLHSSQK